MTHVYCRHCKYDRRVLSVPSCPECNTPFDASDPRTLLRYADEPIDEWGHFLLVIGVNLGVAIVLAVLAALL